MKYVIAMPRLEPHQKPCTLTHLTVKNRCVYRPRSKIPSSIPPRIPTTRACTRSDFSSQLAYRHIPSIYRHIPPIWFAHLLLLENQQCIPARQVRPGPKNLPSTSEKFKPTMMTTIRSSEKRLSTVPTIRNRKQYTRQVQPHKDARKDCQLFKRFEEDISPFLSTPSANSTCTHRK